MNQPVDTGFVRPAEVTYEPYPVPSPSPTEWVSPTGQVWSVGEGVGRGAMVGAAAAITAMVIALAPRASLDEPGGLIGALVMFGTVAAGVGAVCGCAVGGLLTLIARGGGSKPLLRLLGGVAATLTAGTVLTPLLGAQSLPAVIAALFWGMTFAPWVAIHPVAEHQQ